MMTDDPIDACTIPGIRVKFTSLMTDAAGMT